MINVNASVEVFDEDTKKALHKLRRQLSREGYRQPVQCFLKPSTKRYRHHKKLQHLALLKQIKDRKYQSKHRQSRPIGADAGAAYREYLWRKYAGGCTFQKPRKIKRSPWQIEHDCPEWCWEEEPYGRMPI